METSMRLGVGISMRQKGEGAPFGMPQQQPPKIANPAYLPAAAGQEGELKGNSSMTQVLVPVSMGSSVHYWYRYCW